MKHIKKALKELKTKQMQKAEKEKALKKFQKAIAEENNIPLFPNEWQDLEDAS